MSDVDEKPRGVDAPSEPAVEPPSSPDHPDEERELTIDDVERLGSGAGVAVGCAVAVAIAVVVFWLVRGLLLR